MKHDNLLEPLEFRQRIDKLFPQHRGNYDSRVHDVFLQQRPELGVACELARSNEAHTLYNEISAVCEKHGITALKLFPPFVFETVSEMTNLRIRSNYKNNNNNKNKKSAAAAVATSDDIGVVANNDNNDDEFTADLSARCFVLPQDVGVEVELIVTKPGNSNSSDEKQEQQQEQLGPILRVEYVRGVGNVAHFSNNKSNSDGDVAATTRTVPLAQLKPKSPIPLHLDTLLPCGEIVRDGHCPVSVRDITLTMLYEAFGAKLNSKLKTLQSWNIAEAATQLASAARRNFFVEKTRLAALLAENRLEPFSIDIAPQSATSASSSASASNNNGGDHDGGTCLMTVSCGSLRHSVLKSHLEKLRRLYAYHNAERDPDSRYFAHRLFALLTRYFSLAGATDRPMEEAAWHCAVPPKAMRVLHERLDSSQECFASPLNAFTHRFCSAFPDTDCFFGSIGSFFEFNPTRGSFEAGPPYDHQLIHAMFDHMCDLLAVEKKTTTNSSVASNNSNEVNDDDSNALSFVVIMPYSDRPVAQKVLERVRAEGFVRADIKLDEEEYAYIDGYQQVDSNRGFVLRCATRIVVAQNEQGAKKWPCGEVIKEFMQTWASAVKSA